MTEDNLTYAYEQLTSNENIFLTGNAGTGKTTLIKKFISENIDSCIVLAPTGVAALNIGGQTIHRFFGFPARVISYESVKVLDDYDPRDMNRIAILRRAKYLIIDEISMVRADMMDQIAWFFHKNSEVISHKRKGDTSGAFCGIKLIMIGDLDQLPPVVATEEEKAMLSSRYNSEFFFSSKLFQQYAKFKTVKLTKVFRQSDPDFVQLLNDIKNNSISDSQISMLNFECVTQQEILSPDTHGIMLAATNKIADEVNQELLGRLDSPLISL